MRENTNLITPPTVKPTLEVVRNQFEAWRKRRRRGRRIPESLWQAAVGLCREHSVFSVSRALRLNYNGLKNRVPKARDLGPAAGQRPDLGFVRLDLGAPIGPSECLVEMESPNGAKMRMSIKGVSREFDPVELSRAFWRQGGMIQILPHMQDLGGGRGSGLSSGDRRIGGGVREGFEGRSFLGIDVCILQ